MTTPAFIIVGRVRKAHGIRGEVVVEPITDAPDAVFASGRRVFAGTASGDLASRLAPSCTSRRAARSTTDSSSAFAEVRDRTAAETWRDRYLLVPADELPPPGDDEVYVHELPGMRVELESGEIVGTVDDDLRAAAGPRARRAPQRAARRRDGAAPRSTSAPSRRSIARRAASS